MLASKYRRNIKQYNYKIIPSDFYSLIDLEHIDELTGKIIKSIDVPELGSDKIYLKENSILISKLQPEKGKIVIPSYPYLSIKTGIFKFHKIILPCPRNILPVCRPEYYIWPVIIYPSGFIFKQ